jgi:hypothetical protein
MPLTYEIIEDKKLVFCIGTGRITFSELMNHIEELSTDPKYKKPMLKTFGFLPK